MRARRSALTVSATLVALLLAGCASAGSNLVDAAKSQAGAAVSQAQCVAIGAASDKLAGVPDADPAALDSVSSAVSKVTAGLAALGDKVPADLTAQITAAQGQLDAAISQAKVDPATAKASLTAATDKLTTGLQKLSTTVGC